MKKATLPKLKIGKFIDPLTDFGFKRIFGSDPTKDLLIHFLNELFKGRKVIADITFNNNEHIGRASKIRKMIFDLTCTAQDGEQFIIEVQRIKQKFFKDRAIYYISRLINNQAPQDSSWNYSLKEVYFIGIMDFALEDSEVDKCLHWVSLAYENSNKTFYNKLSFVFIEIPKFVKTDEELTTGVDKWLYLLKNLSRLNKMPAILNTRIFSKLFQIALVSNLTKEDFMKYEKNLMAEWDEYAIKKTLEDEAKLAREQAMEEGIAKGMAKGMAKGIAKGEEKGRKEGWVEGVETKSYEVVANLLETKKFTISEIANFAGVSEGFVRKVKKGIK